MPKSNKEKKIDRPTQREKADRFDLFGKVWISQRKKWNKRKREFEREYFTFGNRKKKLPSDCFGFQDILHVILPRKETSWFGKFDQWLFFWKV